MNGQEATEARTNYNDLVGKTVRQNDLDYLVQEIVVVPSDSSSLLEFTDGYLEDGFNTASQKLPKDTNVEVALLCTEIINGSTKILKVTQVEFLL